MEITSQLSSDWLHQEFQARRTKNPAYSLRAFARTLGIAPSRLSEVFTRKRKLTPAQAERIADRLGYSPVLRTRFLDCVGKERSKAPAAAYVPDRSQDFQQLSMDAFHVISDWYHYAILSLMELRSFRSDPRWIAGRLGISPIEVRGALERLERLGLIVKRGRSWVKTAGGLTTTHDVSSAALKRAHRQNLERAIEALEEVPVELRDVTAMTMAIDSSKLPQAKGMIREFRRKLCAFLEDGKKDEVYTMNIQLLPTTKTGTGRKK